MLPRKAGGKARARGLRALAAEQLGLTIQVGMWPPCCNCMPRLQQLACKSTGARRCRCAGQLLTAARTAVVGGGWVLGAFCCEALLLLCIPCVAAPRTGAGRTRRPLALLLQHLDSVSCTVVQLSNMPVGCRKGSTRRLTMPVRHCTSTTNIARQASGNCDCISCARQEPPQLHGMSA